MKKKVVDIMSNGTKITGNRLKIEKKESAFTLPNIGIKEENLSILSQKNKRLTQKEIQPVRKFSIKNKNFTVMPYLMKRTDEDIKNLNQVDKIRAQSQGLHNEKHGRQKIQSINIRTVNRSKNIEKEKKITLHLDEYKTPTDSATVPQLSPKQESQISKILVQRCKMKQNHNQIIFQNIYQKTSKNQQIPKKECQSIGISTDLEIHSDAYKQFLKYKITQKQKYSKMKDVFDFVDNLSKSQSKYFDLRYQNIKKIYEESLQNDREKGIVQICDSIDKGETEYLNVFNRMIQQLIKVQQKMYATSLDQISKINEEVKKIRNMLVNTVKNKENQASIEKELFSLKFVNENQSQIQSQCKEFKTVHSASITHILHKISKLCNDLQQNSSQKHELMQNRLSQTRDELHLRFKEWKQNLISKDFAVKICVEDILRLPQMSLSIFGMEKQNQESEDGQFMKKIGVALEEIPEFDAFYNRQNKPSEMDLAMRQMVNVKCLNCAYLKSKMRFIYAKNKQLQPVMKILNYLLKKEHVRKL